MKWSLVQKLMLFRANIIMAKGPYTHAWPHSGHVVAPAINGW